MKPFSTYTSHLAQGSEQELHNYTELRKHLPKISINFPFATLLFPIKKIQATKERLEDATFFKCHVISSQGAASCSLFCEA
jgi:hypothetical protein